MFLAAEISGRERSRQAGDLGSAGYFKSKFRSLRRDGGEHDRSEQKYYCSGSRTISVCNDQSGDHKENGAFQTEEGCLSLDGVRPCTRYKEIEVDYLDTNFKKQHGKYIGWTAQIIQHEVDHCNGIVI